MGRVLGDLAESGYDAEWDCLPACEFGAPHERERIFIVANAERQGFSGCEQKPRIFEPAPTPLPKFSYNPLGSGSGLDSVIPYLQRSDGLSPRMVGRQLKAYGNAVVPQIAEWIGRRIVELAGDGKEK